MKMPGFFSQQRQITRVRGTQRQDPGNFHSSPSGTAQPGALLVLLPFASHRSLGLHAGFFRRVLSPGWIEFPVRQLTSSHFISLYFSLSTTGALYKFINWPVIHFMTLTL